MDFKEEKWLTAQQLADRMGISTQSVYRLIRSGNLGCYRFLRKIRIGEVHLKAFTDKAERRSM